jgi:hypothetical protein
MEEFEQETTDGTEDSKGIDGADSFKVYFSNV